MRGRIKSVVMIGPALESKGGIASVCSEYKRAGFFDRLNVLFLSSYVSSGTYSKMVAAVTGVMRLSWLLMNGRVRLVHVHVATGASIWRKLIFCLIATSVGVPYIVHLHSGKLPEYFEEVCGPIRKRIFRWFLSSSAAVLVLTNERKEWLAKLNFKAPHIEVLPNFVLPPEGSTVQLTRSSAVFMGRLEEAKGVSTLLEAFALVLRVLPHAFLVLAGEGDVVRYRALVMRLGIQKSVEFLGWVEGAAKEELLARAKVFVLASRFEGLPMAVLEAMGSGVPCIATSVGGLPDIISDGVSGRLVPLFDIDALAKAIVALLDDDALNRRLGVAARAVVLDKFSASRVEGQLIQIYDRATAL